MEEKFKKLKKCFEESQSRGEAEQKKNMEESAREQRNIMAVLTTLMADVKIINTKLGEKNGEPTPISNRERSEVEQNRQRNLDSQ